MEQRCSREDLRALVPQYNRYEVTQDGGTGDYLSPGDLDHDRLDIEEYVCDNCGEFFTPDKPYSYAALAFVWDKAVAHVGAVESEA